DLLVGFRLGPVCEKLLYQTSQTLTHGRHRLSGPKRRYLIGPTDVSATDVPEKRTQHESMSPQVGINPVLIAQIHHRLQLNKRSQSALYKAKIRAGSPADRYEIWNARRYVVAALECYLLAKPNVKPDDEIRKIAQNNRCLKRLIRNATTETRSSNVQLQGAIKRWRKSFNEGTAPDDIQESWNRDNRYMSKKERSPSDWMAAGNNLLKNACDMARRVILPPPVGV